MNRRLLMLVLTILAVQALSPMMAAATSLPAARVAFVHDRHAESWATAFIDSLRQEIERVLEVDYTVQMPGEINRFAEGTNHSVRATLQDLLADPSVDLIVATGPLGTYEASRLPDLAHPVIGCWVLDSEIQGIPLTAGTSGRHNYTFVTTGDILSTDLAALREVVDYKHLAVIGSAAWVAALPEENERFKAALETNTSFVVASGPVEEIPTLLPAGVDAVYLMPLVEYSMAHQAQLLDDLAERNLPVIALLGEPAVQAGALLGVAPPDWSRRVYRRVALVAGQILQGEHPADIPVIMLREERLYLNARTANRIGVSPPFSVMIEAVTIDDLVPPGSIRVDLDATMKAARADNRDIAASIAAVAAGEELVNIAKADLLPQIHLGLGGFAIDKDTAAFFPTTSERTLNGSASLTQVIYSDRAWAGYTIEKYLQEARVGEYNLVELDVGLEAATAYLDVLRAQTHLAIQRQNLSFSRSNLDRAEVRVTVGDANRSELYRWESKIAGEQTLVLEAAVDRRLALLELNRVLARPLEEPLELVDSTVGDQFQRVVDPRVDRFTRDPASLEILRDFLVRKGLENAPELQQFDASILASERANTAAGRSFWLPDFAIAGSVDYIFSRGGEGSTIDDPLVPDDTSWNIGVYASLPLLEGGARFAETRRTTQQTYRLMHARESAAARIERNVRTTTYQVAASRLSIDLARRSAEAAYLNLDIVADNYLMGLVSLVDLLDAQTTALNAVLAAANAENTYLLDLMRVERAIGQYMFFVEPDAREAWIEELEQFARER